MIQDKRQRKLARVTLAGLQFVFATSAFVMIAAKIVPAILVNAVAQIPSFAIGTFSSDVLILSIIVHVGLISLFGRAFWISAFILSAELAVVLVLASLVFQAIIEISVLAIHKLGLDFFGLFGIYAHTTEHNGASIFAASTFQQPLFVAVVLPTTLALLRGFAAVIDSCDFENAAARQLKSKGRITIVGIVLAATYYIARCFNHVAHFVLPMASQVLREERFQREVRDELKHALQTAVFSEAVIVAFWRAINRIVRTACGALFLGIEYVPMWSVQVVSLLLGDKHERR